MLVTKLTQFSREDTVAMKKKCDDDEIGFLKDAKLNVDR